MHLYKFPNSTKELLNYLRCLPTSNHQYLLEAYTQALSLIHDDLHSLFIFLDFINLSTGHSEIEEIEHMYNLFKVKLRKFKIFWINYISFQIKERKKDFDGVFFKVLDYLRVKKFEGKEELVDLLLKNKADLKEQLAGNTFKNKLDFTEDYKLNIRTEEVVKETEYVKATIPEENQNSSFLYKSKISELGSANLQGKMNEPDSANLKGKIFEPDNFKLQDKIYELDNFKLQDKINELDSFKLQDKMLDKENQNRSFLYKNKISEPDNFKLQDKIYEPDNFKFQDKMNEFDSANLKDRISLSHININLEKTEIKSGQIEEKIMSGSINIDTREIKLRSTAETEITKHISAYNRVIHLRDEDGLNGILNLDNQLNQDKENFSVDNILLNQSINDRKKQISSEESVSNYIEDLKSDHQAYKKKYVSSEYLETPKFDHDTDRKLIKNHEIFIKDGPNKKIISNCVFELDLESPILNVGVQTKDSIRNTAKIQNSDQNKAYQSNEIICDNKPKIDLFLLKKDDHTGLEIGKMAHKLIFSPNKRPISAIASPLSYHRKKSTHTSHFENNCIKIPETPKKFLLDSKNTENQSNAVFSCEMFNKTITFPGKNSTVLFKKKEMILINRIGKGGYSSVYRVCYDGELYALKMIRVDDQEGLNICLDEINLLKRLHSCESVIGIVDYEITKDTVNILLEYGETDLQKLIRSGNLSMFYIKYIWESILKILYFIHSNKIVHRDIKPANFVLVKGKVKIIDFGISKSIRGDTTSILNYEKAGTVNYMSPEQWTGRKVGRASDIWSAGCILYHMIFKKTVHNGKSAMDYYRIMAEETDIEYGNTDQDAIESIKACLVYDSKGRAKPEELLNYKFLKK